MSHFNAQSADELFKRGYDTLEIANLLKRSEASVYNELSRRRSITYSPYFVPVAYVGKDPDERPIT